jgi:hypothetical protein
MCCRHYHSHSHAHTHTHSLSLPISLSLTHTHTHSHTLTHTHSFVPDPGMGCDDPAYCPRIFYVDETQRSLAAASITAHNFKINDPMGVALLPASEFTFWKGEESNQHFDQKMGQPCNGQGRAKVRGRTRR